MDVSQYLDSVSSYYITGQQRSLYSDWVRAGERGVEVRVPVLAGFFSSPLRSDRFRGSLSHLTNAYQRLFPRRKAAEA
jgi:hypothetical protein